ncbi:hypothetical protein R1flu_023735 [Riccia fluitans]|uniref:Uncharacterized protein n=1 Tax=Riccia fluitans TaxID=41844 RepID=A0ABD1XWY2_9MARC
MKLLCSLVFILLLQLRAEVVDSTRPCKAVSNARGAETYELRPKDGYFTLVNRGSTSGPDLEYEACDTNDQATTSLPSKETSSQGLPWAAVATIGYGEKQQNFGSGGSLFGASKDVVVTVEEKPMDQVKERLVAIARSSDHVEDSNKNSKEVPAYVIVRKPAVKLDYQDSRSVGGDRQMVAISLDTLNSLIKSSLYPPSGPSLDHNWYVASLVADDHEESYQDSRNSGEQMLVLRVVPAAAAATAQDALNVVADPLPGFQEAADGLYRIQD